MQLLCRHVTVSGAPGCLPNNNPIESYHNSLTRLKLLMYRAQLEAFLAYNLPKTLHMQSMDLCSPITRSLTWYIAACLHAACHIVESRPNVNPVYCIYPGQPEGNEEWPVAKEPDQEGAWAVFLVNSVESAEHDVTAPRVSAPHTAGCTWCDCRQKNTYHP